MLEDSFLKNREDYIVHLLETRPRVTVSELCKIFNMAPSTIRKKLTEMERKGLLIRTHGGAVSIDINRDEPISRKSILNIAHKKSIAEAARSLIHDGDTVALASGSTVVELCYLLRNLRGSIVLTDSIVAANVLMNNKDIEVRICSGIVRSRTGCIVGPSASRFFEGTKIDKVFVGTDGVSLTDGVCSSNILVGNVEHSMAARALEVYVLSDYSKLGRPAFYPFWPLDATTCVITDSDSNPDTLQALEQKGVRTIVAKLCRT